jgi:hypothetical protein
VSGQATGWVLRHGPHPDHVDRHGKPYAGRARGLRSVLLTVADAANAEGQHAHPGLANMMSGSLYSRRQVQDLAAELVAEGWLVVEKAGGGAGLATVYGLPMVARHNGAATAPLATETVQPHLGNGAVHPPETVQSAAETVRPGLHPNGVTTPSSNGTTNARALTDYDVATFDAFWTAYPRHTAKGEARKAWPAAVRAAGGTGPIIDGAKRFAADPNREDAYTPHPATWLRAERWGDDPLPPRARQANGRAPARPSEWDRSAPSGVIEL